MNRHLSTIGLLKNHLTRFTTGDRTQDRQASTDEGHKERLTHTARLSTMTDSLRDGHDG